MCLFTTGYASNAFANTVKEICENTSAMYTISGFFFFFRTAAQPAVAGTKKSQ